jgi:hypothetical protein
MECSQARAAEMQYKPSPSSTQMARLLTDGT